MKPTRDRHERGSKIDSLVSLIRQNKNGDSKPIVLVDLDLTALSPRQRTEAALKSVGDEFGISEFSQKKLSVLPGYSDEAWLSFITIQNIAKEYPEHIWLKGGKADRSPGTPFARFHSLFWNTDLMYEDEPEPGLGQFVESVRSVGGEVVFFSGRWLFEHIEPSMTCLKKAGIRDPQLIVGNPWHADHGRFSSPVLSDSKIKIRHARLASNLYGPPVAVVDDRASNRNAVSNAFGWRLRRIVPTRCSCCTSPLARCKVRRVGFMSRPWQ